MAKAVWQGFVGHPIVRERWRRLNAPPKRDKDARQTLVIGYLFIFFMVFGTLAAGYRTSEPFLLMFGMYLAGAMSMFLSGLAETAPPHWSRRAIFGLRLGSSAMWFGIVVALIRCACLWYTS